MGTFRRPASPDDVLNLLRADLPAAALRAALELGLFWRLTVGPRSPEDLSETLGVPIRRCRIWLELLTGLHLLEREGSAYGLSAVARTQIIETYSQATWQLLAREARERDLAVHNLTHHLTYDGSVWEAQGRTTPDYVKQMMNDPEIALRYARMFHELGRPLGEELAGILELSGAHRLMDLGGSSGAISLALLRQHPQLTAVVVDLPNVCAAGQKITEGIAVADRLSYHPADFFDDPLPQGFDVVLECKAGVYDELLLRKIAGSLHPGGRLVVVDELVQEEGRASLSRLTYAFLNSLQDPSFLLPSALAVWDRIVAAGFQKVAERRLSGGETVLKALWTGEHGSTNGLESGPRVASGNAR